MTIILVSTAFVSLMQVLSAGLFAGGDNENQLVAINLAQEKIDELRNKSYSNIVNETKAAVSGFPAFQREVAVTSPQAGLKQVSVNLYWFSKADELSAGLATYVSDI